MAAKCTNKKPALGVSVNDFIEGKNDLAYENFGKTPPEKWCQAEEKFLPVH